MKRYKLYKKIEPVSINFEKLLTGIILPLVVVSYISYPVLYFSGTKAMVLFNVIGALTANYYHKDFKSRILILNSTNNDSGYRLVFFRFISFLIVLMVLLIADFGFYLLVLYQKNNEFNIFYFYSWLLILFGLPLFYYSIKLTRYYYIKQRQAIDFVKVFLIINHDSELLLSINNVQFINTVNRKSSNINIKMNMRYYSQKEFIAMKTKTREYYANKHGFREPVQIPFNTNTLLLSWFSFVENKYYSIEIPFPFDQLIIDRGKHSTNDLKIFRGKVTKPLYLQFYPNGAVKLLYNDEILTDYPDNKEIPISEEDIQRIFLI